MPYLSVLEVCSRRGAIQIHVYNLLHSMVPRSVSCCENRRIGLSVKWDISLAWSSNQFFTVRADSNSFSFDLRSQMIWRRRLAWRQLWRQPLNPSVLQWSLHLRPSVPRRPLQQRQLLKKRRLCALPRWSMLSNTRHPPPTATTATSPFLRFILYIITAGS